VSKEYKTVSVSEIEGEWWSSYVVCR